MWLLGSVLFVVLVGSSGSGTPGLNITARPGDDVTLMCEDPEFKKISSNLEWSRNDSEILFVFRDGKPFPPAQHESFRNRVFLNVSLMKDGNLSVVLKNVTMNDNGMYICRVIQARTKRAVLKTSPISSIRLSVDPPGDKKGSSHHLGLIVLAAAVILVVVGLWIYRKKKGPNQSSGGSNNQQNPEEDHL